MLETMNEYKAINEKMGETVSLAVKNLSVSEYNTRSACIDWNHVEYLSKRMLERGFHPKRAISVNVIRGSGEGEMAYRVAAGIHRLEAAKKSGLIEIPCLLYYDLTEEEECLLDKWDNEMDEDHKPIHFLEEAEHYRYLYEVKKWSYRQIGRNKGVDHMTAARRVKIAELPEQTKAIIRNVDPGLQVFWVFPNKRHKSLIDLLLTSLLSNSCAQFFLCILLYVNSPVPAKAIKCRRRHVQEFAY